jgi:hypothetical protein
VVRFSTALCGIVLSAGLAAACGATRTSPHVPGSAREPRAAVANAGCIGCHEEIGREWRASNHAEAFRHDTFQTAYAIEPLPFCVACHAPETSASRPSLPESDLGVACVTCHVGGAKTSRGSRDAGCLKCHEFPYPGETRLLQKTVSEHQRSGSSHVPCTDCHMGLVLHDGGRHTDHRFLASRSSLLVRSASKVEARRDGDLLFVTFTRVGVGHAFPTGDLFRRLRLVATSGSASHEVVLDRQTKRDEEVDNRPFADGRDTYVATVPLDGLGKNVTWRVVYERVGHPTAAQGNDATIDGAIEIAHGTLD